MNNEYSIQNTEDYSQDQGWLILLSLITDIPEKEWNDYANDLIYKNRFLSTHKVIDVIKGVSEKCTETIIKGKTLYRARVYHQDPLRQFLVENFKNTEEKYTTKNPKTNFDYYNMLLGAILMAVEKNNQQSMEIIELYNKWKRKRFKGFNSADSGVPPVECASPGRLNPEKIRYLYLAEDSQTAIYEVRPTIGQHVSVATFKVVDDIKIYNLAKDIKAEERSTPGIDYVLYDEIQKRFSEPNTGYPYKYIPTQYLGELIKQMGFDGVRFKSSLKKGGNNIVLFDDKKCKPISSDIIKVDDIELKFDNPDIYQLEELLKDIKNNHKNK